MAPRPIRRRVQSEEVKLPQLASSFFIGQHVCRLLALFRHGAMSDLRPQSAQADMHRERSATKSQREDRSSQSITMRRKAPRISSLLPRSVPDQPEGKHAEHRSCYLGGGLPPLCGRFEAEGAKVSKKGPGSVGEAHIFQRGYTPCPTR